MRGGIPGRQTGIAEGDAEMRRGRPHGEPEHDEPAQPCPDPCGTRRGIVDADEAKRNGKDADNIADGFRISGLGQLIEAGIKAE